MIHHRTSYTTLNASLHQASTTTITKPPQPPAAGTPTTVYQVAGFQQVARLRTNGLVDYRLYPSPASPFSIVLSSFSSIRISTPPTRLEHSRECRAKDRHQRSSFKISIVSRRCSRKSWLSLFDARARRHTYTRARYIGTVPFYFRSPCVAEGDEQSGIPILWLASDSLSHYLYPIAGLTEPFLFVAVDGISSQLELDLSNPRVIALPARFSSFFPRLPPQNLSTELLPRSGIPSARRLDACFDLFLRMFWPMWSTWEILAMNGKEYVYIEEKINSLINIQEYQSNIIYLLNCNWSLQ